MQREIPCVSPNLRAFLGVERQQLVHAFESKLLSDEEIDADLRAVGLRRVRELDELGSWIEAALLRS